MDNSCISLSFIDELDWCPFHPTLFVILASKICVIHLSGGTMSVVLGLPFSLCVWISAAVAITYTLLGGLYSVAYTDVIQLILIFVSLVTSFNFYGSVLKTLKEPQIPCLVLISIFLCSGSAFPLFWQILTCWTSDKHWATIPCTLHGLVKSNWRQSGSKLISSYLL